MCGRLLCCLNFEQGNYDEFQRKCPKIGKRLNTTLGTVKILRTNLFRETVSLLTENGEEKELTLSEWQEVFIGAAPDSQTQSHPEGRPGTPGEAPSPAPVDAQPESGQPPRPAGQRQKNGQARESRPDPRGRRPQKKRFAPKRDDQRNQNRPAQEQRPGPRKNKPREGSE
jgi:hypothetical protein